MKKLKKILSGLCFICLLLLIWSVAIEPGLLVQRDVNVPKWNGPNLRIAFFSDLHAGAPFITESYIKDLIERINKMEPDIVLIGGDLVITGIMGGKYIPIEVIAKYLQFLKPRLGVHVVLGNHDWWDKPQHITQVLKDAGMNVMENEAKLIELSSDSKFWLVGIGDDFSHRADVKLAMSQVATRDPQILFMHDPGAIFQAKDPFFLALAGHLHGGQIFVPGMGAIVVPSVAPKEWAKGWVDFELGSIFVSKGIGTSILPVRLNALPEFVILELKKE